MTESVTELVAKTLHRIALDKEEHNRDPRLRCLCYLPNSLHFRPISPQQQPDRSICSRSTGNRGTVARDSEIIFSNATTCCKD